MQDSGRQVDAAGSIYVDGAYASQHPEWHLEDADGKAMDLFPYIAALVNAGDGHAVYRIADVGAGVGGVLAALGDHIAAAHPTIAIESVAYEVSPQAVEMGESLFPELTFRNRAIAVEDGPYDLVLLVDVLEHLENPAHLLRTCAAVASSLIVRQPLLENFSTFRHQNYREQRETWGHIAYFNYYSFLDLAEANGWLPHHVTLVPQWQLNTNQATPNWLKRRIARRFPVLASYFLAPFYLVGSFVRGRSVVEASR